MSTKKRSTKTRNSARSQIRQHPDHQVRQHDHAKRQEIDRRNAIMYNALDTISQKGKGESHRGARPGAGERQPDG